VPSELWAPLLLSVGFFTMVLGVALALRQTDLKAILAFTTVSQLGFLCGSYGLGAWTGVRFDYLHILNHTLYKGGLFMLAGLIDHACHTRDVRELGGLARRLPATGVAALLGLAAMAGVSRHLRISQQGGGAGRPIGRGDHGAGRGALGPGRAGGGGGAECGPGDPALAARVYGPAAQRGRGPRPSARPGDWWPLRCCSR
jgi:hypothetical protein